MDETKAVAHFAGEDRDFWLPMARIVAFEREADCSLFALFYAIGENVGSVTGGETVLIGASDARLRQCHSLIRNALIGAGVPEKDATEMVKVYCYPARPAMHDLALCYTILNTAIYGIKIPESSKKKPEAESPDPS
ncbi:GTA-gp10 family protein [Novosphingobium sp. 28-62-57]|uniref:GTA-gp10 family protein n=1 Tax=Novosphingobium sp. 28-62-57 TaxID=1970409 RepID=UPI0025D993C7|nr:GTA-gp10 family protein [Novosphingobium sp. 28-62-57]HQS96684.1 GTA-gp10 family protein [Novosphingobium sp.]